jgi:hypothetical protein
MRRVQRRGGSIALAGAAATALAIVAAGGGCELVVGDSLPEFACEPNVADACPAGSVCIPATRRCANRTGTCTPGAPSACSGGEACDPNTLHCGSGSAGLSEAGADATADGRAQEAADSGMKGDALALDHAAPDGAAPEDSGQAGTEATSDAPIACRGLTCTCSGQSFCDSGICADNVTVTPEVYKASGNNNFCTQPCCTSADCNPNTVCFGTGRGGNYCVAPQWIGRVVNIGTAIGGTACKNGSECRSGLCANGACADTCCSTSHQGSQCAAGTLCRFAAFPGTGFDTHVTASCGAATGAAPGSICAIDGVCQSGKCSAPGPGSARCEAVCRSSGDCSANQACAYNIGPSVMSTQDIVAGCVAAMGTGAVGSNCQMNGDCATNFCDGTHCTDVCFSDNDCPTGVPCRPRVITEPFGGGMYEILSCGS